MGIRKSHGRFYKTESEQCTIKAIRPERRPEHPPHYKTRMHNKIKLNERIRTGNGRPSVIAHMTVFAFLVLYLKLRKKFKSPEK